MLTCLHRWPWHLAELRRAPGKQCGIVALATAREGAPRPNYGAFITRFYYCQTQPLHSGQELMNHDSLLHLQNAKYPGEKK